MKRKFSVINVKNGGIACIFTIEAHPDLFEHIIKGMERGLQYPLVLHEEKMGFLGLW